MVTDAMISAVCQCKAATVSLSMLHVTGKHTACGIIRSLRDMQDLLIGTNCMSHMNKRNNISMKKVEACIARAEYHLYLW